MRKLLTIALSACMFLGLQAQETARWAQVNLSIAHMRTTKGNASELCSQEYMGMPVKLLEKDGSWWKIESTDGYNGWMGSDSFVFKTPDELDLWRKSPRLVVIAPHQIWAYDAPDTDAPRHVVTDLVPCDIVEGRLENPVNERVEITLPDGRKAWADASAFATIEEWASQPFSSEKILEQAYSLVGTPYLWGGNSVKALDCSGLSKMCYLTNGIFLLRDASMQVNTGQPLDISQWPAYEQGDLIFFGNAKTGKITHVGIYDQDGYYVHSTGLGDRVRRSSIDPKDPVYAGRGFIRATRINGSEGTRGIVKASQHPWLF